MSFKDAVNLPEIHELKCQLVSIHDRIDEYGHCSGYSTDYPPVEEKAKKALAKIREGLDELDNLTDEMEKWYGN